MTPPTRSSQGQAFRSAVEMDEFCSVHAALQAYVSWFRSEERSIAEIAQARDLLHSAVQIATTRKSVIAAQLARLQTVSAGYTAPRISSTWGVDI